MERGWYQGDFIGPDGSLCALGACQAAMGNKVVSCKTGGENVPQDVYEPLLAATGSASFSVPAWNDEPRRTIHEVLDAFDKAEKLALIREEAS